MPQVTQSKAAARATYDRLSRWYDRLAGSEQRFVRLGVEMLGARRGESVLEIGPGTGHGLEALARAVGGRGAVAGLDLSPGMLARSRQTVSRAGLARAVRLVCADGSCLPLVSGAFDAAFLSFALELFPAPEIPVVVAECRRVLRPGGRIVVVSLARQGSSRAMLRLYEWAHTQFPAWVDCRPIEAGPALQEGGFRTVAASQHSLWGLPVQTVLGLKAEP